MRIHRLKAIFQLTNLWTLIRFQINNLKNQHLNTDPTKNMQRKFNMTPKFVDSL